MYFSQSCVRISILCFPFCHVVFGEQKFQCYKLTINCTMWKTKQLIWVRLRVVVLWCEFIEAMLLCCFTDPIERLWWPQWASYCEYAVMCTEWDLVLPQHACQFSPVSCCFSSHCEQRQSGSICKCACFPRYLSLLKIYLWIIHNGVKKSQIFLLKTTFGVHVGWVSQLSLMKYNRPGVI